MAHRSLLATAPLVAALAGCAAPGPAIDGFPARPLDRCGVPHAPGAFAGLDLAIAIQASTSTSRPSGGDVDGDGLVGEFRHSVSSDRGDSLLAAQAAAVKSFLRGGVLPDARVSVVAYSGRMEAPARSRPITHVSPRVARTYALHATEREVVEAGLDRVLARGSRGAVDFTAALMLSLRALRSAEHTPVSRRRVIVLMATSPTPILGAPSLAVFRSRGGEDPNGPFLRDDPGMAAAVKSAIRHGAIIHTLGLGRAAEAEPPHALSRLAGASGGTHLAVRDPIALDCALLRAVLSRPPRGA